MELHAVFSPAFIALHSAASTKEQVIDELATLLDAGGALTDKARFLEAIYAREAQTATAVGLGVAIPHGKTDAVRRVTVAFSRTARPVSWNDESVELVFMLAVPGSGAATTHLEILATLAQHLLEDSFRQELLQAPTPRVAFDILQRRLGSVVE